MKKGLVASAFSLLLTLLSLPTGSSAGEIPSPVRAVNGFELFSVLGTRTIGAGNVSVGGELEVLNSPDIKRFSALFAYGVTDDLELWGTLPYTAAEDREAVGDIAAGIKYRFFHEGRYGPAVGAALGINLPTGQQHRDSVAGSLDAQAMIIGTKRLGPFTGNVNLGYTLVGESEFKDEVTAALGLEFAVARNITILGELCSRNSRVPDTSDLLEWRIGYKLKAPGGIVTKIGLGFPFGDRDPDYRILIGLSWNQGLQ